jgi:hypothetical protein
MKPGHNKTFEVAVTVLAILAILAMGYYFFTRNNAGAGSTAHVLDGRSLSFSCGQGAPSPDVTEATYGPVSTSSSCPTVVVTELMAKWAAQYPGSQFWVSPSAFPGVGVPPCTDPQGRQLTIKYNCSKAPLSGPLRESIIPRRVDTCTAAQDMLPAAMADPDPDPDPDPAHHAHHARSGQGKRPMHPPINPLTSIGITGRVRNWANPYSDDIASSPCSSAVSVFQVQPFQPGYMAPKQNDSTDGTAAQQRYHYQPAYWSRASGPLGGPYRSVASCPEGLSIDPDQAPKETLRSRGGHHLAAREGQCLAGIGCGLGSTWIDPRIDPGPQAMYPGGDAAYAHGGHAGGPTSGAFIPAVFQTSGSWGRHVHGFGDGDLVAPAPPRA